MIKEGTTKDGSSHNSSIFFSDNKARECGGAVYVADEIIDSTCEGSAGSFYSDATECFIQILTVLLMEKVQRSHNLVAVEFKNNSALCYLEVCLIGALSVQLLR